MDARVSSSVSFPPVGIVADDITGAGDIGVMFAKAGCAVRIFSADLDVAEVAVRCRSKRTDVAIIDTDSRYDRAELAAEKVRSATRALRAWGAQRFIKKTCSVFRGNVGAELDALLEVLDEPFAVALAAFPKNGRTTVNGLHRVHGRPLAESEFAQDPVHPRTESNLRVELAGQTRRRVEGVSLADVRSSDLSSILGAMRGQGVGYALCDAETQDDVRLIARAASFERVLVGSSALSEELPALWPSPQPFSPFAGVSVPTAGGVLVVAGSVMPQTRDQLDVLSRTGVALFEVDSRQALLAGEHEQRRILGELVPRLLRNESVAVRLANSPERVRDAQAFGLELGMSPVEVSQCLSTLLGAIARSALAASGCARVVALGGDTSAAVCRELEIQETVVLEELAPGLPSTLSMGARPVLLVLKSGSFGGSGFVLEAIKHLRERPAC
jgi:uncharacterized protein YgbK (DUF1537 family)